MTSDDESLPDPEEHTRVEQWLAEHLTPYRVFWIKQIMTVALILAFLWAGSQAIELKHEAARLTQRINESGCSVVYQEMGGSYQRFNLSPR